MKEIIKSQLNIMLRYRTRPLTLPIHLAFSIIRVILIVFCVHVYLCINFK